MVQSVRTACFRAAAPRMSCTARQEREMKRKYENLKNTSQDPLELLRAHALSQGCVGIKSIARWVKITGITSAFCCGKLVERAQWSEYIVFLDIPVCIRMYNALRSITRSRKKNPYNIISS